MKIISIVVLLTCFSLMNCTLIDLTGSTLCSALLTQYAQEVDLPALIGLWCQLSAQQQSTLLTGLVNITNGLIPSTDALVTIWGQLNQSQQALIHSTFVKIGLLPQKSKIAGDQQPQLSPKDFIQQKLLPTVKLFFSIKSMAAAVNAPKSN